MASLTSLLRTRSGSDLRCHFLNPPTHLASPAKGSQKSSQWLLKQPQRHHGMHRVGNVSWQALYSCPWKEPWHGQASLTVWNAHLRRKPRSHFCILYISPSTCALPRTPSSPPDQSGLGWRQGCGAVLLLLHKSLEVLTKSFCEVQKCPLPHKLAMGRPLASELQSILQLGEGKEQVYQFHIQVYKSKPAPCQVLS